MKVPTDGVRILVHKTSYATAIKPEVEKALISRIFLTVNNLAKSDSELWLSGFLELWTRINLAVVAITVLITAAISIVFLRPKSSIKIKAESITPTTAPKVLTA